MATHLVALSFRDSGAGPRCDWSASGRPCWLQCGLGWRGGFRKTRREELRIRARVLGGEMQTSWPSPFLLPTLMELYPPPLPTEGPISFAFQTLFPLSHRHTAP